MVGPVTTKWASDTWRVEQWRRCRHGQTYIWTDGRRARLYHDSIPRSGGEGKKEPVYQSVGIIKGGFRGGAPDTYGYDRDPGLYSNKWCQISAFKHIVSNTFYYFKLLNTSQPCMDQICSKYYIVQKCCSKGAAKVYVHLTHYQIEAETEVCS